MSSNIESKFYELFQPVRNAIENAELAFAEYCRRELDRIYRLVREMGIYGITSVDCEIHERSVQPTLGGYAKGVAVNFHPYVDYNFHYEAGEVSDEEMAQLVEMLRRELPVGFLNPRVMTGGNKTSCFLTLSFKDEVEVHTR